tara:strand:- start:4191 stop:4406 length:216 start_codon:yes stop_codon:yes gene_type:complete
MCIVATMYMYRELNKTKTEMDNVRGFYGNVMEFLSRPPQKTRFSPRVSEPEEENKEISETQVDDDEDDSSE